MTTRSLFCVFIPCRESSAEVFYPEEESSDTFGKTNRYGISQQLEDEYEGWKEINVGSEFPSPIDPESILYNDYMKQKERCYEDPSLDQPLVVRHKSFVHQPFLNQSPNSISLYLPFLQVR